MYNPQTAFHTTNYPVGPSSPPTSSAYFPPPPSAKLLRLQQENARLKAQLSSLSSPSSSSLTSPSLPASIIEAPLISLTYHHCSGRLRRHLESLLSHPDASSRSPVPPSGSIIYFSSFGLDTQGFPIPPSHPSLYQPSDSDLWAVPQYVPLSATLPLPYPPSLPRHPTLSELMTCLNVCFNCGSAVHTVRECRQERDQAVIRANGEKYRQWQGMRERQRGERQEQREERERVKESSQRYYEVEEVVRGREDKTVAEQREEMKESEIEEGEVDEEGRTEHQQLIHKLITSRKLADTSDILIVDVPLQSIEQLRSLQTKHHQHGVALGSSPSRLWSSIRASAPSSYSVNAPSPASSSSYREMLPRQSSRDRASPVYRHSQSSPPPPPHRSPSPQSSPPSLPSPAPSPLPSSSSVSDLFGLPLISSLPSPSVPKLPPVELEEKLPPPPPPALPIATPLQAAQNVVAANIRKWTPARRKRAEEMTGEKEGGQEKEVENATQ